MAEYKRTINRPRLHNYVVDASESNLGDRPQAGASREYSGTVRPNGSGSFGFTRRKGEQLRERTRSCDRKVRINAVQYLDWDAYPGEGNQDRVVRCSIPADKRTPLTLSEPLTGRKTKKRVAKGLTRHGIRVIESSLTLLETKYRVKNLGFYTLTCPFNTTEAIDEFNAKYPVIVKRFLEKMKRYYDKKGQKLPYVGVYEIQEQRANRTGQSALHFHFLAPCRMGARREFVCSAGQIRDWYREAIENALPGRECPSPRVGVEVCRKSSIAYIAKYYSKGISSASDELARTKPIVLSSWYVVYRGCVTAYRRACINVGRDLAERVIRHHCRLGDCGNITFSRDIRVMREGCMRLVGYVFTMSKDFMSAWLEYILPSVADMI